MLVILFGFAEISAFETCYAIDPKIATFCPHVGGKLLAQSMEEILAVGVFELYTHGNGLSVGKRCRKQKI